ncbi:hypothetical protein [Arcticibacter tournemirensis]
MRLRIAMIISLFLLVSCGKEESAIPDVYVNYRFSEVEYMEGRNENLIYFVSGHGVAGLMIYKISDGNYVAFDRCSTVNPEKRCAVISDESAFTVTDPCSGGKFSILDGAPAKAPATRALKQYDVSFISGSYTVIN